MSNRIEPNQKSRRWGLIPKRGEHLVVIQFIVILGFIWLPVWRPGILDTWAGAWWAVALAVLLGVLALIIGALGTYHLRTNLTPLPYPVDHNQLVQTGIYGLIRHPLYTSLICIALSWTLYQLSLSHMLALPLFFGFFAYKAAIEERWLRARHPEYADYAQRVRAFFPWIY